MADPQTTVIELLRRHGYIDAGEVRLRYGRGACSRGRSPGRDRRGFGGRQRMRHGTRDNDWVTVGAKTTSFYRRDGREATGFENFRTRHELSQIARRAELGRTREPLTFGGVA